MGTGEGQGQAVAAPAREGRPEARVRLTLRPAARSRALRKQCGQRLGQQPREVAAQLGADRTVGRVTERAWGGRIRGDTEGREDRPTFPERTTVSCLREPNTFVSIPRALPLAPSLIATPNPFFMKQSE